MAQGLLHGRISARSAILVMTLNDLLNSNYVKFGRAYPDLDCYGLVRLARHSLFGKPMLPEYAQVDPQDKPALTRATLEVSEQRHFIPAQIAPGAVATAWRAKLCVHLGLVIEADGRLWVLETDENIGPVLTRPSLFEQRYTRVIYYAD